MFSLGLELFGPRGDGLCYAARCCYLRVYLNVCFDLVCSFSFRDSNDVHCVM